MRRYNPRLTSVLCVALMVLVALFATAMASTRKQANSNHIATISAVQNSAINNTVTANSLWSNSDATTTAGPGAHVPCVVNLVNNVAMAPNNLAANATTLNGTTISTNPANANGGNADAAAIATGTVNNKAKAKLIVAIGVGTPLPFWLVLRGFDPWNPCRPKL